VKLYKYLIEEKKDLIGASRRCSRERILAPVLRQPRKLNPEMDSSGI
jgi:hypothetical protein